MKEIVKNNPPAHITVGINDFEFNRHKYYGVSPNNSLKGFITRTKYNDGEFIVVAARELTNGNGWPLIVPNTDGKALISDLLTLDFHVYEFGSFKHLFDWLNK